MTWEGGKEKERSRGGGEGNKTVFMSCVSLESPFLKCYKEADNVHILLYSLLQEVLPGYELRQWCHNNKSIVWCWENISLSSFDSLKIDCQRLSIVLFMQFLLGTARLEINAISSTTADDCCVIQNYRKRCLCIERTTGDLVVLSLSFFPFRCLVLSFKQHKLHEKICMESQMEWRLMLLFFRDKVSVGGDREREVSNSNWTAVNLKPCWCQKQTSADEV